MLKVNLEKVLSLGLILSVCLTSACAGKGDNESNQTDESTVVMTAEGTTVTEQTSAETSEETETTDVTEAVSVQNTTVDSIDGVYADWDSYLNSDVDSDDENSSSSPMLFSRYKDEFIYSYEAGSASEWVVPFTGSADYSMCDNYWYGSVRCLYGLVDKNGQIVCDPIYNEFQLTDDGLFWIFTRPEGHDFDIISFDGTVVIDGSFDFVDFYKGKIYGFDYVINQNDDTEEISEVKMYVYDYDGNELYSSSFDSSGLYVIDVIDENRMLLSSSEFGIEQGGPMDTNIADLNGNTVYPYDIYGVYLRYDGHFIQIYYDENHPNLFGNLYEINEDLSLGVNLDYIAIIDSYGNITKKHETGNAFWCAGYDRIYNLLEDQLLIYDSNGQFIEKKDLSATLSWGYEDNRFRVEDDGKLIEIFTDYDNYYIATETGEVFCDMGFYSWIDGNCVISSDGERITIMNDEFDVLFEGLRDDIVFIYGSGEYFIKKVNDEWIVFSCQNGEEILQVNSEHCDVNKLKNIYLPDEDTAVLIGEDFATMLDIDGNVVFNYNSVVLH